MEEKSSKEGEGNKTDQVIPWTSLPVEILSLILSHCFAGDYLVFRSVCRQWQSMPNPKWLFPSNLASLADYETESPILVNLGNDGIYTYFDPIRNHVYRSDIPELGGAQIHYANCGWWLMGRDKGRLFFFNPSTKAIIKLPDVPNSIGLLQTMCFFHPPTSSDCLIVGVNFGKVGIFRIGEEWTIHNLPSQITTIADCNPVLHNGKYYCVTYGGALMEIELKNDQFKLSCWKAAFHSRPHKRFQQNFLVESEGELIGVFTTFQWEEVHVYRWDESKKKWERLTDLGNRMLFISRGRCFSEKAIIRGTRNKIFFPFLYGIDPVVYSVSSNNYYSFYNPSLSSKNTYNIYKYYHAIWIKPT